MSPWLIVWFAALGAGVGSYVLTGVAVRVAVKTGFVDYPSGYKAHRHATPYLGGAAVLSSVVAATVLLARVDAALAAILATAATLALVGAVDDRMTVPPGLRVAIELAACAMLFSVGVQWSAFDSGVLDFVLSAAWVVGIVNAFNLMDNIDGATATVTGVSSAGLGLIALLDHQTPLAITAFAVTGACLGFLPRNLSNPARIFLGDGGSMPLGFIVAALSMAVLGGGRLGSLAVVGGVLAAGLPVLDTTLVVVSRRRRGVPFVTGGRDHLTHRLQARAGSARRVAMLLAVGQSLLAGLGIGSSQLGSRFAVAAGLSVLVMGAVAVILLESPAWRPNEEAGFARNRTGYPARFAAFDEPRSDACAAADSRE